MAFVQDDDVVQTLAPDRADYPFDVRILPVPGEFLLCLQIALIS